MCGSMELHFVTNKILTNSITGSLSRTDDDTIVTINFTLGDLSKIEGAYFERIFKPFLQLLTLSEQLWEVLFGF